jgi:hypothetical protein
VNLSFIRACAIAGAATAIVVGCTVQQNDANEQEPLGRDQAALSTYGQSIQNVHSGKCLHAAALSSGSQVQQSTCNGSNNQKFLVENASIAGLKIIRNTSANLCVVPTGYSGWSDTEVSLVLASCSLAEARFTKESPVAIPNGERTGFRWAYDSGFCAHAPSTTNGVQMLGRLCNGMDAQKFEVRVTAAPPPPPPPPPDPPPCRTGWRCCAPVGTGCAECVPSHAQCN